MMGVTGGIASSLPAATAARLRPQTQSLSPPATSLSVDPDRSGGVTVKTTPANRVASQSHPQKVSEPLTVYTDPRIQERQKLQQSLNAKQQNQQTQQIQKLAARDREVRTHEQAHQAAGGQYAGAVSYQFERGPNGVSYAIGGEVPISTGKESTPEATLAKAQMVRRAALAPAEPSAADRGVAAEASRLESEALAELMAERQKHMAGIHSSDGASRSKSVSRSESSRYLLPERESVGSNLHQLA